MQPEFFVQIGDYVQNIKEDDIDNFLDFESFDNIILFWGKTKTEKNEFLLGIFFINFKEKKCLDCREIDFDGNKKYLFKINKNTNEIYIFNLSEEFLYIFSFITKKKNQIQKSADDLYLSKIKFSGNIKGIDFTANNGMVVLTEQYNLVCYSRNEYLYKSYQKTKNLDFEVHVVIINVFCVIFGLIQAIVSIMLMWDQYDGIVGDCTQCDFKRGILWEKSTVKQQLQIIFGGIFNFRWLLPFFPETAVKGNPVAALVFRNIQCFISLIYKRIRRNHCVL